MRIIDAHEHLPLDTAAARTLHQNRGVSVLNICVDSPELGGLAAQRTWYDALHRQLGSAFQWVTSFSLAGFGEAQWADRAIADLDADFARGAVGCKIWKNVGMELRDPSTGAYVFLDDPRFDPILRHLQGIDRPLLLHIAEPIDAWRPLDTRSPHYAYFNWAKQWHWHNRTDVPSHERLIASRDAVVERYPTLRVIGLHYGSQEHDLPAVAERLRKWPNYFVDTAARLGDMVRNASADHARVRDFHTEFADRIIWGVDVVMSRPASAQSEEQLGKLLASTEQRYEQWWQFLATSNEVKVAGYAAAGLNLPPAVLQKLMCANAQRVYGIE